MSQNHGRGLQLGEQMLILALIAVVTIATAQHWPTIWAWITQTAQS